MGRILDEKEKDPSDNYTTSRISDSDLWMDFELKSN